MNWIREFYSRTGQWWGNAESTIGERDYERLATVERLGGTGPKRILDLGSSFGNTAAVMAQAGHEVVGVEISDRIEFVRQHATQPGKGTLRFVKADFYEVTFDDPFDVVCYWNGFGVGTDRDQRTLLRRMADEWLTPDGIVVMDVANPACCIRWAGDEEHLTAAPEQGYHHNVSERTDFDPVRNRFIDTWWETEKPEETLSQHIRCYSPADFLLLLEGTGLRLDVMEVDGEALDLAASTTSSHSLWTKYEYLVKLSKC
jgi:SAM-dependent methyltransferase